MYIGRFIQQPRGVVDTSHAKQEESLNQEIGTLSKKVRQAVALPQETVRVVVYRLICVCARASIWRSNSRRRTANYEISWVPVSLAGAIPESDAAVP